MDVAFSQDAVAAVANFRQGSMSSRVYDLLREAIIQLKLRPGNLLSETELAKQLGVSRQPVRESFIKLAEAGLVEVRPQRGTFVQMISRREVENARFIREAIEVAFARKAAADAVPGTVTALCKIIGRQEVAQRASDALEFLRQDEAFHRAIARGIGYESAWNLLDTLRAQMDRVRFLSFPATTPLSVLIRQHRAIVDAIEAGDADRAEAAMRGHLRELLASLPKIALAHPDLFVD